MYLDKILKLADTDELFKHLVHPYTQALMSAVPIPDPKIRWSVQYCQVRFQALSTHLRDIISTQDV